MTAPALTPAEYAAAYRLWQQQTNTDTAAEIASILDMHTLQQRAAVERARAITECHDAPEAQAARRADLMGAITQAGAA